MKYLFISVLVLMLFSLDSNAQTRETNDVTKPYAETVTPSGEITQYKEAPKFIGRVYGTMGAVYGTDLLENSPSRSINKISGMTLGVQTNGSEPVFKGAPGGTAYFIDGIRVRSGSLGIAGFSF